MANLFCIKDKVIILTGGCGILGGCMAKYLAGEGARVVILDRNVEGGRQLAGDIKKAGGRAIFLETDVLNKNVLLKNKDDILENYGQIDVLINLAGGNMAGATIPPDKTFFDLDVDAFRKVVDLNL
ncbi:MAG: SDR family NAD(P)-dependent oxidoreductase, partial [Tannerella sp.]|nr:SDR family NAD(P)-dependent oxidoreductase [Tannerella sp.]